MLGQIVLVREERPHSSKLQDAFAAVQHRQLVPAHKLMTKFLVVGAVAGAVAASIRIVEAINRLLAKCLGQFFQRGRFIAAQKDLRIHVANDGISIVFVDSLELAAGLQDQTGRNLTAADGRHQLFELRNLPDVGALVDEATHMDRQLAAILVICLIAEQVEKLGVNHGNQKVEGAVCIAHDKEQCRFPVAQLVQLQLIVHGGIPNLLNVEGRQTSTTGNKDALGSLSRDPLYRQYEQLYTQNAHNASADAAAQAAALTGGYGSSYATSAAQQAYQQQIGGLASAIPTLYNLALDTYQSGGEELVNRLDQLNGQEQNAQTLYDRQLQDYYTQLQQKGEAYNDAYAKDYGQYQEHLNRLDTLHGYYTAQEQAEISQRQQTFNNIMTVLGVIGDVVQLAITGTTGLGTLAGSLLNTGYNIYSGNRAYEAERADTQWSQQMQEKQRQDALTQQQYDNTASERAYQDALKQQAFNNNVTTQKLNIAKGEWALKQANARQKAAQAASKAAAARTKSGSSSSGKATGSSGSASGDSRSTVSAGVPYTAALLRSQGKNDVAITSALRQEGYTPAQIAKILQEMNK